MNEFPEFVVVWPNGSSSAVWFDPLMIEKNMREYEARGAIEIWREGKLIGGSAYRGVACTAAVGR